MVGNLLCVCWLQFFPSEPLCFDMFYVSKFSAFGEFSFKIRDFLLKQFSKILVKAYPFIEENLRHRRESNIFKVTRQDGGRVQLETISLYSFWYTFPIAVLMDIKAVGPHVVNRASCRNRAV